MNEIEPSVRRYLLETFPLGDLAFRTMYRDLSNEWDWANGLESTAALQRIIDTLQGAENLYNEGILGGALEMVFDAGRYWARFNERSAAKRAPKLMRMRRKPPPDSRKAYAYPAWRDAFWKHGPFRDLGAGAQAEYLEKNYSKDVGYKQDDEHHLKKHATLEKYCREFKKKMQ